MKVIAKNLTLILTVTLSLSPTLTLTLTLYAVVNETIGSKRQRTGRQTCTPSHA